MQPLYIMSTKEEERVRVRERERERGREKVGYDFFCDFVATLRRYHDIMTRILSSSFNLYDKNKYKNTIIL